MGMLDFLKKKAEEPIAAPGANITGDILPPPDSNPSAFGLPDQQFGTPMGQPQNLQLGTPPIGSPSQNNMNFPPNNPQFQNSMPELPPMGNPNLPPMGQPMPPMKHIQNNQNIPNGNINQPIFNPGPPQNMPEPQPMQNMPEPPAPPAPNSTMDSTSNDIPIPKAPTQQTHGKDNLTLMTEDLEHIAESIIEDKFGEVKQEIEKLSKWKAIVEAKVTTLTENVKEMEKRISETQTSIMSKVSDYNKTIKGVDSELKALSKIFEKIMPTFTTNVKKLSNIVSKAEDVDEELPTTKRGRPRKK
jgi:hypothetical protein